MRPPLAIAQVQAGTHAAGGWGSSNYGFSKLALIAATKAASPPRARPALLDVDVCMATPPPSVVGGVSGHARGGKRCAPASYARALRAHSTWANGVPQVLARELPGVAVNACCPGYCATDMSSHRGPRFVRAPGHPPPPPRAPCHPQSEGYVQR